tara:strand:- start:379 stop:1719 length:1341 start_codon:yes stop_codon:yes gene_type:complete
MDIKMMEISSLQPYERNPRKNDKAVDVVANSLDQYGFQQPIVVDNDRVIIVGHTRYRAAKQLGYTEVPVVVANDLDDKQVKAYRIMDNRSAENAHWDDQLLFQELEDLIKDDSIHELAYDTGYTENELERLFRESEDDPIVDFEDSLKLKARRGDLFTLGEHKLVCGDSTDSKHLSLLLGEERVDLLWEDPPYGISYVTANNVNYSNGENKLRDRHTAIKNDDLTPEQLDILLEEHIKAILPYWKPGAAIYWSHDIRFTQQFRDKLEAHDIHISDTLIWKKQSPSNWMADYAKYYEPILYGWKKGEEHKWYAKKIMNPNVIDLDDIDKMSRDDLVKMLKKVHQNIFEFGRASKDEVALHPTVKPPKLIAYNIMNSTKPGDIVYDGFSGSGSTLMACDKTGRCGRAIEFDPKYVDATIRRWQDKTGGYARHADGTLWNDMEVYDAGE